MKKLYVNWQEYRAYSVELELEDREAEEIAIEKIKNHASGLEIADWGFQGYVEGSFNVEDITNEK